MEIFTHPPFSDPQNHAGFDLFLILTRKVFSPPPPTHCGSVDRW